MIIWRGLGIFVPFIAGIVFFLTLKAVEGATGNPDYTKWNYWPKALAGLLAAVAIWFVGRYLNNRPGKVVIEKDTGKEVVLRPVHDVFFLKFEYWAVVIMFFVVVGYFV